MTEPALFDAEPYTYREEFVCWSTDPAYEDYPYDNEHPSDVECDWGWACPVCHRRVDNQPCPEHAPISAPGLRLVECQAEPRHWLFAHDRDDYGHGCPWCWYEQARAELQPLQDAAERRAHRWCWLFNPLKRAAIRLRLAKAGSYIGGYADWHVNIRWRWSR